MSRFSRFVEWAINDVGSGYEVVRYENGQLVLIGHYKSRDDAWTAAQGNRAMVLADPTAHETQPMRYQIR